MLQFDSKRRAGFECGATGAKLVLLTRRNADFQVENVFIEDVLFESRIRGKARQPFDNARQLLLHKSLSGYRTTFVATGVADSCFVILPGMSKAETDSAILLQARKLITLEVENPILAYISSGFLRERVGSLVGLGDWQAVKAWCRLIENSGSLIDDVTLGACAYQALARFQRWAEEFPVFLVADLGATASTFYVLDRTAVRFMRKIPVGGDALTRVLMTVISTASGSIQLSESEAEEGKITGFLPLAGKQAPNYRRPGEASRVGGMVAEAPPASAPGFKKLDQMEVLVRPLVERIASEIARSIQFYKDNVGQNVAAVFLTGGTAGLQSLRTHLETTVGLPVRTIDPFAGLAFTHPGTRQYAEKHKTRLALAAGLALAEKPAISLLPQYLQVLKRFAVFMPKAVAALLVLGFVPFLLAGMWHGVKMQTVRSETHKYQEQLQRAGVERQKMEALQNRLQEATGYGLALRNMVGRNPLWPGILNALADALPADIVLTRFGAGSDPGHPDLIVLEGKVLPAARGFDDAMATLLPALGASVFFKQVNIVNAKAERTDSMLGTFEIQCVLVH